VNQCRTSTKATREHYARPEIKETILRISSISEGSQQAYKWLNGDSWNWYEEGKDSSKAWQGNDRGYSRITGRHRTLYHTTTFFKETLFGENIRPHKHTPQMLAVSVENCIGMSALFDIDAKAAEGGHGSNIHEPEVKRAVELLTKYVIDYLRQFAPNSVYAAFSGGGTYVLLHHNVFKGYFAEALETEEAMGKIKALPKALNKLIERLNAEFREKYPDLAEFASIDPINNPKRIVKTLLSVHKKYDYAVIPLDLNNPIIDFEAATLPISPDVLESCKNWYSVGEESPELIRELSTDLKDLEFEERRRAKYAKEYGDKPIVASEACTVASFPPCIRGIITRKTGGVGATRALATLAAFLGVVGWSKEDAKTLFDFVANRWGAETSNLFDSWFDAKKCPSCKYLNTDNGGYPHVDLLNFGVCKPDQRCQTVRRTSPAYYASHELYSKSFKIRR